MRRRVREGSKHKLGVCFGEKIVMLTFPMDMPSNDISGLNKEQ